MVLARRSGRDWYIAAINDGTPRRLELELDFLAAADYQVELWLDGATPGEIRRQQQRLDADHRALVLDLDANGGAVARLVAPPLRIATTP